MTARPAGPGLLESVGWTVGYLVVQVVAAAGLVLLLILAAFEGWPQNSEVLPQVLESVIATDFTWLGVYVTGGATLGALFFMIPAAFVRLRPAPRRTLGTHLPDGRQLVLLAGSVLPLAILSDELYRAATLAWEALQSRVADIWPAIEGVGQFDTMDLIQSQTAYTAYPLLLVIVGVGPAIGEELIFRGVIGRGLINRYGVIAGVLITSLLFGIAHGTPAHALATIPLAIFLHLTYLATRTLWAPILVHFLNNALSVTMLKYGLGENMAVSLPMLVSAGIYVTAIGALMWHVREGGPARHPSQMADVRVAAPRYSPHWLSLLASAGVVGFTWTFVAAAMAG